MTEANEVKQNTCRPIMYVSIKLFHDKSKFKNWLIHLIMLTWYIVSMLQLLKSNTCIYSIYQNLLVYNGFHWPLGTISYKVTCISMPNTIVRRRGLH